MCSHSYSKHLKYLSFLLLCLSTLDSYFKNESLNAMNVRRTSSNLICTVPVLYFYIKSAHNKKKIFKYIFYHLICTTMVGSELEST